ncbi:nucleotide pyrophosphohydrolase [Kribbella sp. NPDC051936]|uniref:nucleotide pyrophosphohydrolase n=1 Tax=Kribbella sp. NPDC051936 TaxID=3154946 RepID=UPI00342D9619
MSDPTVLRDNNRAFTEERDWVKFHDPKSLLLALVGEVGELTELFQWLPAAARAQEDPLHTQAGEELADVLIYVVRLADILNIDLSEAAFRKLNGSSTRYPADQFRGRAPEKT